MGRTFFDHPAFDAPERARANREGQGRLDRDIVDRAVRETGRSVRLTDLLLHIHQETQRAWLVSITGAHDAAVWLPKSEVEVERRPGHPHLADVTLPEWLATERGLV